MPWNAAHITDYQLYRRRLIVASVGIALAAGMLADTVISSGGNLTGRDLRSGVSWTVALVFFAYRAFRELSDMRTASR